MKQKILNKTQRSIFLSNYIRIIYCYAIFSFFTLPVYTQWLDAYIPDFKVNDDNLNSYQVNSQIGVDSAGNFVVVWRDVRVNPGNSSPGQVYCQRFDKNGLALGINFRIGQDTAGLPCISVLKDGKFIIAWLRFFEPLNKYEIFYQRFNKNGTFLDIPRKVTDSIYSVDENLFYGLNISTDTSGKFIICWSHKPAFNANLTVYFQRFDSSGIKIGSVDSVNEASSDAEFPSVAMNNDGSFVIVWQDNRQEPFTAKYDIYMQRYNTAGVKIGNNVKVNDDINALMFRGGAKVSNNGYGQTIVVWTDPRLCNNGEVFFQLYDITGNSLGINRKGNNSPCGTGAFGTAVDIRSDKKFFIYWTDLNLTGREQSYGRKFDSLGIPIGNQYMVPSLSPNPTNQRADAMKILNDRVYCTWTYFIPNNYNTDIYCNVRGFQNPDTVIGIINTLVIINEYMLYDAYPNPFNPVTNIKYQLSKAASIKITIFDIKGQQIEVLQDKEQLAGTYEIKWDASSKASGIYFVRMESQTGFNQTKKIMLIK